MIVAPTSARAEGGLARTSSAAVSARRCSRRLRRLVIAASVALIGRFLGKANLIARAPPQLPTRAGEADGCKRVGEAMKSLTGFGLGRATFEVVPIPCSAVSARP